MSDNADPAPAPSRRSIRWWPAGVIVLAALGVIVWFWTREDLTYQQRNLNTLGTLLIGLALLLLWWLILSRARWQWRVGVLLAVVAIVVWARFSLRIRGVSGDLLPIVELRSTEHDARRVVKGVNVITALPNPPPRAAARPDFPQFCGPNRDSILAGPALDPDWKAHPPQVVWRIPVGVAWSGFAVVGDRTVTQEQRGEEELVTCYDVNSGHQLWSHADAAHYNTVIAGEGPRATPTVVSNRVFTVGATGVLNCLDLESGRPVWSRRLTDDAGSSAPGWGFSGSPLVLGDRVVASGGGHEKKSLLAYQAATGEIAWAGGTQSAGYSSPCITTLAGVPQLLMFNARFITAHRPDTGAVLWEYKWGNGQPHVALPVVVGTNRVVFSSGYGVGAELLEISPSTNGLLAATRVWKSIRMKAKFHNPVARDGFLYGLDDGVFACVDLKDGSQRWKEGRYGHGQGLLVGEHYLLMAESGELVLLRPTPDKPDELGRFAIFNSKTWNPIALSGDLLLVRNDREAACLRLAAAPSTKPQ